MHKLIFILSIFILFGCSDGTKDQVNTGIPNSINSDRSFVSFRIQVAQWISEKRCNELFDLFDKYKGVTDEITFFTSATHAPTPLDEFRKKTGILKVRMEQARQRGYKTGINILTTIGHHNENLENSLKGNYTYMTNLDGEVCHGTYCPNDENMQEYIRTVYQYMAEANPDYIWIDDDIRFAHMPIGYGCFCDNCLEIFEKETGTRYSRESLRKAMNEGQEEDKLKLRKAWLQHNRNTISRLFGLIETTVREIDPDIDLGFMTGDRFFEGYDFDNWAKILSGPGYNPVMWRPGGGYYDDHINSHLFLKTHSIGRQVALLPADVFSIQSEIENFPWQPLRKAANITVFETCAYIAAGCTGTAYNVLSTYDEPLDQYEPLLTRLQEVRPFCDLMARTLGRFPITGVQTFWNKDSYSTGNLKEGNWLSSGFPVVSHEFYEIGLPACYSNQHAPVTILGGNNVLALSKDEIKKLLSGGVYMDAETLKQLNKMGFGELTGFEVAGEELKDQTEKFTDHPLNGAFAGRERDNRQSFWYSPAYKLKKTNENAQILTKLIDYTGKETASCTTGIFENKLGGRICIAGYYPWSFMGSLPKSSQMKSVFNWLSKDKLPGYIASFHKVNLWIREPQQGQIALALSNSSFDPAKNIILMLRTNSKTVKVYDMKCKESVISSSGTEGPYQKFIIPDADPWQMRLVVTDLHE
ncbi:MAG: hypothetical protein AB2L24_13705 [Mangrovibacterium sp.]